MAEDVPFDLYGDLEDAYDEADRNGDVEIVETLDTFGLWDEKPKCNHSWMHTMWRALKGDVEAQADVGHAFYWNDHDPEDVRETYKWLDKPELAIYWYRLAAEAGYAAAQKLPCGMLGLAHCLRCGKCCCCDRDIPRAKALEAEVDRMEGN